MSNYKLVTQSYPRNYWDDHGDEILDTANELHDDKWSFKESRELLSNGLRTRGNEATQGSVKQVFAQGAAIWFLIGFFGGIASISWGIFGPRWFGATRYGFDLPTLLTVLTLLPRVSLAFTTRWPAMLAIATTAIIQLAFSFSVLASLSVLTTVAIAVIVAKYGTGRRVISPIAMVGLIPVAVALGVVWFYANSYVFFVLLFAGLLLARFDARLLASAAIGAIVFARDITWGMVFGFEGINAPQFDIDLFIPGAVFTAVFAVLSTIVVKSTRSSARRI